MNKFYLSWGREGDVFAAGELDIPSITESDVRSAFGLGQQEYPGDCLEVTDKQVDWLSSVSGMSLNLNEYIYFLNIFSEK